MSEDLKLKELIVDFLFKLKKIDDQYGALRKHAKDTQGRNFPTMIYPADEQVVEAIIDICDAVLGFDLASYIYYECINMSGGGSIKVEGKEYKMKTKKQIMKYIAEQTE